MKFKLLKQSDIRPKHTVRITKAEVEDMSKELKANKDVVGFVFEIANINK